MDGSRRDEPLVPNYESIHDRHMKSYFKTKGRLTSLEKRGVLPAKDALQQARDLSISKYRMEALEMTEIDE